MHLRTYRRLPAETGLQEELASFRAVDSGAPEAILLWEAESPCAVLPRGGSPDCHLLPNPQPAMPVLRRESGGGAVVLGPGCLNYAVVVSLGRRPRLLDVEHSYAEILCALALALRLPGAQVAGSDLALGNRKFAGHAQRRTRHALLHHGTILYGFDLRLISRTLCEPRRRPAYRGARRHADFLANAPLSLPQLIARLADFARALSEAA